MAEDEYSTRTKTFGNGDIYIGTWSHSTLPDGEGKYTWRDGSTYEGSWKEGVRHGIGKYTWSSGATYHGEWRDGRMSGVGTWESADGLSRYQGGWLRDTKHGLGRQVYASGDVYEGLWKHGSPWGPGRYVYSDGNEYDGEWRGGRMHGQGTFVWHSGERYDGEWKEGRMDGSGVFSSADGSVFDGRWRRGRKHGIGIFRPSQGAQHQQQQQQYQLQLNQQVALAALPEDGAPAVASLHHGGGGAAAAAAAAIMDVTALPTTTPAAESPSVVTNGNGSGGDLAGLSTWQSPHPMHHGMVSEQSISGPLTAGSAAVGGTNPTDNNTLPHPQDQTERPRLQPASNLSQAIGPNYHSHHHIQHLSSARPRISESRALHHSVSLFHTSSAGPALRGPSPLRQRLLHLPFSQHHLNIHKEAGDTGGLAVASGASVPDATRALVDDGLAASGASHAAPFPGAGGLLGSPALWRRRSSSGLPEVPSLKASGAGGGGPGPTAGTKLVFVRMYDKGRLLRETALSADELDALLPGGLGATGPRGRGTREDRSQNPTGHLLRMLRGGRRAAGASSGGRPRSRTSGGAGVGAGLGDPVTRAHPAYPLMVALQLGIRYSVGRISHEPLPRNTSPDEYGLKVQQEFSRGGSEMTPVHPGDDFMWSDYAPMTFRRLRESFGVDASTYMLSLCSDHSLRHLTSPGKSGSVFFLSQDERFFIKTMSRAEMAVLLSLLPAYHRHVERHPHTLLCRFFGVHCVTASGGRKYRFVVMSNIFRTPLQLHRKYDLKGSTLGRTAGRPPTDDPTVIYKDLDLDLKLRLEDGWRDRLLFQLRADCGLLSGSGVMDYSLLVGLHFRNKVNHPNHPLNRQQPQPPGEGGEGALGLPVGGASFRSLTGATGVSAPQPENGQQQQQQLSSELSRIQERLQRLRPRLGEVATRDLEELISARVRMLAPGPPEPARDTAASPAHPATSAATTGPPGNPDSRPRPHLGSGGGGRVSATGGSESADGAAEGVSVNEELALSCGQSRVHLGTNMAATAVHPDGREEPVVLWFAIIDVLQPYNATKKLEHSLKSVIHAPQSISVTHPATYATRFQAFLKRVFE